MMERVFARQSSFRLGKIAAFLLAAVLLWVGSVHLSAATFTASLDDSSIVFGETATLTLSVEGGSSSSDIAPPSVDGLRFQGQGSSQQYTFVNGAASSKNIYNFAVMPQRTGEFTIPAITAIIDGQKVSTLPLKLSVTKPGSPSAEAINSGQQSVFMKLVLPKKQVYAGEVFNVTVEVYVRQGARVGNFQLTSMPADGLVIGKNGEGQHRNQQIGNSVYEVVPIVFAVTAVKSGDLTVGPVTATIVEQVISNNRRRSPFDDMPDPFGMFQQGEQRRLNLATDETPLQSLRVPVENAPKNFTGTVGNYFMTVTAGPTNVTAGDPITLRVQIAGHGALDSISLPTQAEAGWEHFKTYPPTSKVETTDALATQGAKTFEEIVVPQNSDVTELPPVSFTYFDPDEKKYKTLTQAALPLTVKPGGQSVAPTIAATINTTDHSPPPTQDIVPIKQRLGNVRNTSVALVQQPWFLGVQSLPVLTWMTMLVWRKRKDSLANNPRLRRQREVARVIQEGLASLRTLARENKSEEFFATLFHLLQEKLGERLDMPASAITESVVDERLRPKGIASSTIQSVEELFQLCNLARYAPVRSSQELAAVISKLEAALTELEEVKA